MCRWESQKQTAFYRGCFGYSQLYQKVRLQKRESLRQARTNARANEHAALLVSLMHAKSSNNLHDQRAMLADRHKRARTNNKRTSVT